MHKLRFNPIWLLAILAFGFALSFLELRFTYGQQLIIDDNNAAQIVAQGKAAGHATGYDAKLGKMKLRLKFTDQFAVVPRSQWKQLVQEGQGTFLSDLVKAAKIPCKDQDGESLCWCYASVSTVETLRAVQGLPYVALSPESVCGPITGWRNQGGYGIDALNQLASAGCCANSFMDRANSLSVNRWKPGWQADAEAHKITASWASVDNFDEVFTALLYRMPVSIGLSWWSHQVLLTEPCVLPGGGYGVVMRNSWGAAWPTQNGDGWSTLTESKSQPSGSFAAIGVLPAEVKIGEKPTPLSLIRQRQGMILSRIKTFSAIPKACEKPR